MDTTIERAPIRLPATPAYRLESAALGSVRVNRLPRASGS